jgi:sugar lactone lactonase YvrE/4-amino-4-deoxy-L-arabinose transferase-like glycosyltransferase
MSTEITPAAPLINLLLYLSAILVMVGTAVWLNRRPASIHRATLAESDALGGPSLRPAFPIPALDWSPQLGQFAERWRRFSLFVWLEAGERGALWAVFGVTLIIRLAFLETVPRTVSADEIASGGDALGLLRGQGPSFFGLDGSQQSALGVYLISWSWRLFGTTIFAERLVAALLTTVAIVPFYALVRRAVAAPAALAAALLFASSYWFLLFSRSGWTTGPILLYALLAAWALTRALDRQRWRDWAGFGATLALLLYGDSAGRSVVPALLVYLVFALWWRWRGTLPGGWRRPLAGAALAAGVCLVLFLPLARVARDDLPRYIHGPGTVSIFSASRAPGQSTAGLLARQAWATVRSFVLMDTTTGTGRYKGTGQAWLDPLSAALFTVGLVLAVRRARSASLWWCLFLIPLVVTQILTTGDPDGARGFVLIAPMFYFVALALDAIIARPLLSGRRVQLALAGLVAFAVVLNLATYLLWMGSSQAVSARQPAFAATGFNLWRDFQLGRLGENQGIMSLDEYIALAPETVVAQVVAGAKADAPSLAPPEIPTQQFSSRQVATVGGPGDGAGKFDTPRSVAVDRAGNYYVADPVRGKVLRYAPDGTFLSEWGDPDQLAHPWSIAIAPDDTVVVLNAEPGRVLRYDQQGVFIEVVAAIDDFQIARGMALGLDGRLYVAVTSGSRLVALPATGPAPTPLTGPPTGTVTFDQPTAVIAAADGTVYVYEPDRGQLWGFGANGRVRFTQQAPKADTFTGGALALLPDGRLLLADPDEHRVLVFRPDGALLGSFAVEGTPQGLAVSATGRVAVTDVNGRVVRLYEFNAH